MSILIPNNQLTQPNGGVRLSTIDGLIPVVAGIPRRRDLVRPVSWIGTGGIPPRIDNGLIGVDFSGPDTDVTPRRGEWPSVSIPSSVTVVAVFTLKTPSNRANRGILGKYKGMEGTNPVSERNFNLFVDYQTHASEVYIRGVVSSTGATGIGPSGPYVPIQPGLHTAVFVYKAASHIEVWVDGKLHNSMYSGVPAALPNTNTPIWLGNQYSLSDVEYPSIYTFPGTIHMYGLWRGAHKDPQWLCRNPWSVFESYAENTPYLNTLSGNAYTLLGDASSYLLSGQDSGLHVDRLLGAQEAAFSVSGQDAGTYIDRVLTAQDSSFVLSGRDADLLAGRALPGGASEFLLSGQDANLLSGRVLAGQANSFAVSGQDASLIRGYALSAGQAAYLLSGQDASLVHTVAGAYVLTANKGDFSLQGQDAMLLLSRVLTGNAGGFSVAGVSADMLRGLSLLADAAAYIASGGSANLVYTGGYSLVCEGATFSVSPQDAQLLLGRVLQAAGQGFTLTGRDAQFISGVAEAVMIGDIQWRVAIQRPDNRVVVGRPDNRVIIN